MRLSGSGAARETARCARPRHHAPGGGKPSLPARRFTNHPQGHPRALMTLYRGRCDAFVPTLCPMWADLCVWRRRFGRATARYARSSATSSSRLPQGSFTWKRRCPGISASSAQVISLPSRDERRRELLEIGDRADAQGRMCLRRRPEGILDADVQLAVAEREPASPSHGQQRRLLDLGQLQQVAVERACRRLTARRRGDLDMMQPGDSRHRDSRPSYSGFDLAPATMNVIPSGPAPACRLASASTRR